MIRFCFILCGMPLLCSKTVLVEKGNLHVLLALSGEISVCNEIGYEKDRNALFRSFYVVETDLSGHS